MFCDIVNSTGFSNRLDPEDVRDVFAAYRRACLEAIQRYDGYVAKYIGDGILVFFGYPLAREDAAESSLQAALALVKAIPQLNDDIGRIHGVRLAVRIGIATGLVVVGDVVGGGVAERDAVTGEAVNLAARLQAVADPNIIVVSAPTRQLAGEGFEYRDLGMQDLKGFDKPVHAYQVVSEKAVSRLEARGSSFTPFVGRHHELAMLCERWERVLSGSGQAVAILGEAGIGKSRAAMEARSRIGALQRERSLVDPSVLAFQCSPHHTNASLFPIVRQLEVVTGIRKLDTNAKRIGALEACLDRRHSDCSQYLSLLADLLGLKPDERCPVLSLGASARRHLTIEALKFWCDSHRANCPLIVVFEDVQWIDPTSKLFLSRLTHWIQNYPVLVIVTLRMDPPSEAEVLKRVGFVELHDFRPSHVTVCEMHQLPDAETKTLIAAVAGGKTIRAADKETILKRSEGNPLYIEELTKALIAAPTPAGVDQIGTGLPPTTLPNTLADALMARLDGLGPTKDIAQQASVIGQEFSTPLLSRISAKSLEELYRDVEVLISSGLVLRNSSTPNEFRFKHTLFHEIAYASLLKKNRRELHRKIGNELVRGGGGDIYARDDAIAWHYSLGELPAQSVAFWHRAAKEAISRSAHEEALAMLDFALEDYKKQAVSTPTVELDLILAKATALRSMSGYSAPAVAQAFTRARDLCEASEHSNNRFNVEWGLFQANLVRGNLGGARTLADQLMKDLSQHPGLPKVDALLADGMAAFHFGDFERARHSFQAGVALARPESDEPHFFTHGQNPGVFCLSYLAHAQCFLGQLDKARETIECSVAISRTRARNPAHIYGYVNALTFAVRVHEFCGDVGSEKQRANQIIDISRRNGFAYYAAVSTCHLAWTTGIGVSLTDGISKMTDGIVALERTGTSLSVPRFFILLAELYIRAGQLGKAEQAIEKASASEQTRTHAWDAEIERVRGDIIAMKPDRDVAAAMSAYEASLAISRRQKARLFELKTTVSFARQLQKIGRQVDARELLGNCLAQMQEGLDTLPVRRAQTFMRSL